MLRKVDVIVIVVGVGVDVDAGVCVGRGALIEGTLRHLFTHLEALLRGCAEEFLKEKKEKERVDGYDRRVSS